MKTETTKSFMEMVKPHEAAMHRTAFRYCRDEEDAKDIVQVTLMKGFKAYSRFQQGTNFKAWIFRILVNNFLNEYRKVKRAPVMAEMDRVAYGLADEAPTSWEWDGHSEKKCRAHLSDEVNAALSAMPEVYRTVVLLADIEGHSYKEIAAFVGAPKGTIMSRLNRGRKILRESLGGYAVSKGLATNLN